MVSSRTIAEALALTEISGIASGRVRALVNDFGGLKAIYSAEDDDLLDYHFIDVETITQIRSLEETIVEWEDRLETWRENGIELVFFLEDSYPQQLTEAGGPLLLYCRGDTSLLQEGGIGFTGTRSASDQAIEWTRDIAEQLGQREVIISGGALGVDGAAHKGALDAGGETIVVFGTGLNVPYPEAHEPLFDKVVEEGGLLVSQRPPDAGPSRSGFLKRNETLTALSDAVTVVATDGSGGTMATYRNAKEQGKQIYCPDPELKLQPVGGIREIANEEATPIQEVAEILTEQVESEDTADDENSTDTTENADSQSTFHEFT